MTRKKDEKRNIRFGWEQEKISSESKVLFDCLSTLLAVWAVDSRSARGFYNFMESDNEFPLLPKRRALDSDDKTSKEKFL